MQVVKFINQKNEEVEFSSRSSTLLVQIDGLSGLESTDVSYTGYMQDGEAYQSSRFEKRQIIIKFHVVCESESNLLAVRSKIHRVFNPKLGSGTLVYEYKGVSRKIKCVADGLPTMELASNVSDCSGEVILLAHDPFLLDDTETTVNVATWRNAFKFPLTIPKSGMIFGYKEPSLIANVINNGDVECGLTIEFIAKGTVKNPSLLNINTQEYIKVNRAMVAGERITVSTGYNNKKIVSELDGITTNIMNYLDLNSTFLQLEVGDNLFRYDADDNLSQLEVNIRYTQRYLGI